MADGREALATLKRFCYTVSTNLLDRYAKAKSNGVSMIVAAQCRMARAALYLGVRELAEKAKVSTNTITRFEGGQPLQERTLEVIQRALEAAGVEFTNGGQPGVRLRAETKAIPVEQMNATNDE